MLWIKHDHYIFRLITFTSQFLSFFLKISTLLNILLYVIDCKAANFFILLCYFHVLIEIIYNFSQLFVNFQLFHMVTSTLNSISSPDIKCHLLENSAISELLRKKILPLILRLERFSRKRYKLNVFLLLFFQPTSDISFAFTDIMVIEARWNLEILFLSLSLI